MRSELNPAQIRVLDDFVERYADDPSSVQGSRVRAALLPSLRGESPVGNAAPTNEQGESIMAKATKKSSGRTPKAAPTKAQINRIASLRRDGATWDEVIADTGYRTNSTGFRIILEDAGFDKFGRKKGSNQASKAKGWGSASNGKPVSKSAKKAPKRKRVVKRTKATAKK